MYTEDYGRKGHLYYFGSYWQDWDTTTGGAKVRCEPRTPVVGGPYLTPYLGSRYMCTHFGFALSMCLVHPRIRIPPEGVQFALNAILHIQN